MTRALVNVVLATGLLVLPLWVWRQVYPNTDWAGLFLLPLALAMWKGIWPFHLDPWLAKRSIVLQEGTFLARHLTGRIWAFLLAVMFVPVATLIVGWQALTLSPREAGIALAAVVGAGLLFQLAQGMLVRQVRQPFARAAASSLAGWITAIPLSVALAITFRAKSDIPAEMLDIDLFGAVGIALREGPDHGGWLTEIFAVFRAFDAAKLWVAITLRDYPIVAWIVSLDAALYSLILCRAAIALTALVASWHLRPGPHRAAPWFWGGLIGLCAMTLVLVAMPRLQIPRDGTEPTRTRVETGIEDLRSALDAGKLAAVDAATAQLDPLLDEAFQPAYAAIPVYADFHYSLFGEYAEMAAPLFGQMTSKLEETVFAGLGARLDGISASVDKTLLETFESRVVAALGPGGGLGAITEHSLEEMRGRLTVSVPVSTLASVGSVVAVKAASKALAEKIAVKMLAKAGAKTAGKFGSIGAGAGTGALACSWSGPGAALCGLTGAVVVWVASDYVILRLDELWTRDDFEADLRGMLDAQKASVRGALHRALLVKAVQLQDLSDDVVQAHAFALQDLSGEAQGKTCRTVESLFALYSPLRTNPAARSPEALAGLRSAVEPLRQDAVLMPLAKEITANLDAATTVEVARVLVSGLLPDGEASGHPISGVLVVNDKAAPIPETDGSFGVDLRVPVAGQIRLDQPFIFALSLEQHDWLANPYFGTGGQLLRVPSAKLKPVLEQRVDFEMPIARDGDAQGVNDVDVVPVGPTRLSFGLILKAKALPDLMRAPNCAPRQAGQ